MRGNFQSTSRGGLEGINPELNPSHSKNLCTRTDYFSPSPFLKSALGGDTFCQIKISLVEGNIIFFLHLCHHHNIWQLWQFSNFPKFYQKVFFRNIFSKDPFSIKFSRLLFKHYAKVREGSQIVFSGTL